MTRQSLGLAGVLAAAICLPAVAGAQTAATAPAAQPFALVAAPPQPPPGVPAHVDVDLRCLALSMVMSTSSDPQNRAFGPQMISYYLGRVDGRGGKGSLEARLSAQFASMKPGDVSPQAAACVQIMLKRDNDFRVVALHLLKKYGKPVPQAAGAPPTGAAPAAGPKPAH